MSIVWKERVPKRTGFLERILFYKKEQENELVLFSKKNNKIVRSFLGPIIYTDSSVNN